MKRSIRGIVILLAAGLIVVGMFLPAGAAGRTEAQEAQWERIKEGLLRDYEVCQEHCGGDQACLDNCEKAYKARMDRRYQAFLGEGASHTAQADIQKHPSCPYCGMDRQKFAYSRVYVEYYDGSTLGTCSIHCAAVDMAVNIDKAPVRIQVGDYNTRELIDAETAVWTIGGDKMGVMTRRAKWAFNTKGAAEAYIKEHGGEVTDFEAVMRATYEDMYQDTKMIREKRKMKRMMKKH